MLRTAYPTIMTPVILRTSRCPDTHCEGRHKQVICDAHQKHEESRRSTGGQKLTVILIGVAVALI
ncbi:hypothetical protein VB735_04085 [Halotia wernerae UHCC 0503]|nr:hypothetical protein [Halotia wernerae UHCC 0503]